MKKVNKLTRSIIAVFMAALMFFSLPSAVYAYIGAIIPNDVGTSQGTVRVGSETYAFLQNEYIYFDICIASTNPANQTAYAGLKAHTVPRATMPSDKTKLDQQGYQIIDYKRAAATVDKGGYDMLPADFSSFGITSVKTEFNKTDNYYYSAEDGEPYEAHGDIVLEYRLYGPDTSAYTLHSYFSLVKLNKGDTEAEWMDTVNIDEEDDSVNWGVVCESILTSSKQMTISDDSYGDVTPVTFFRMETKFYDFAKTGHESIKKEQLKDIAVSAQTMAESGYLSRTVISNGISQTAEDSITEVYCDSYDFAAPFVAASRNYYYSMAGGVEGHDNRYAASVSYSNDTLVTYGQAESAYVMKVMHEPGEPEPYHTQNMDAVSCSLWGYRNLKTEQEVEQQEVKPDKFDMAGSAQYLAVFPDKVQNGKQLYKVVPLADSDAIKNYEKTNGIKSVASYRGPYLIETNNDGSVKYYKFNAGVAALSPTIIANWDAANGYFRLKPDGTPEFDQSRISLNAPTFKFYSPKSGGGLTFDGYDSKLGIKFGINADKNNAYINIDLPGNGVSVKGASVDTAGNLVFTGKFKINLFVAQMEMLKLGYGLNTKSEFVCNGVHAKGKLKVPKIPGKDDDEEEEKDAKPNVLGFGGASMEGEINTFKGEELYDFKFELTVKNLFKAQAQLKLVRLKNGRLCPENLYFELNMTNGVGIDLTPATPAVTITGGGGGISGLASTIDGNYTCIPPVVLTLVTTGQVVKIIDGKLTAKIGPSILRLIGTDVGLKVGSSTLKVIDRAEAGIYLTGKEITYGTDKIQTRTYRGVTFGGDIGLGIKIFNFKDGDPDPLAEPLSFFNNTISADFGLGLETYAGGATDGSDWMYMYIGTYGLAACSLNFPAGIPGIGGKSILGASLQFKIIAQSAFPEGSVKDFFKNAKLAGAIVAEGHALGFAHGRITYILPKTVKFTGRLFKDLDEVNWDDIIINKAAPGENRTVALGEPEVVELEDGDEAIAFVSANITPVKTRYLAASYNPSTGKYSESVRISTASIPDDENLILAVVPKNQSDIDALESSIECDKLEVLKELPDVMTNGDETGGYNYWRGSFSTNDDGSVKEEAIYLALTKAQAAQLSSVTTISAGVDFDVHGLATTPVTGISGSITNDTATTTIENPEDGKNYSLYTYFGKKTLNEKGEEEISTDYIVEGKPVTNVNGAQITVLNAAGNIAPTDDYYVTTSLVETRTVTAEKEDGTTETEEVEIPVASWVSASTYHYTNTTVPAAPASASIELIGNESVKASWKKVDNADGYKLTIYQQDGTEWIDTQRGLNFTNEDFEATQGLSYDEATQTCSAEVAVTVGGDGEEATITGENGETITISEEEAKGIKALEPGKTYKIGVQAYKTNTITLEGEETSYDEYSEETQTSALYLPVYKPVTFDVCVGGVPVLPVDGVYNVTVNNNGFAVTVENAKDGGTDVSGSTVFTVSQTGFTDSEGNDYSVPLGEIDPNVFLIPDFEGTVSLEISAKYTHDGVTDETLAYLYVSKDNIAPAVSLDSDTFYADKNGNYTVSGTTEPGAKVVLKTEKTVVEEDLSTEGEVLSRYPVDREIEREITADSDGKFTYTENFTDGDELCQRASATVTVYAKDDQENTSQKVSTIITSLVDISSATVSGAVDKTYTGEPITQDFVITLDDGTVLGEDSYDVEYTNNINAGTASYRITCKGVYDGEFTGTFKINRVNIGNAVISGVANKVYNGKPFTQTVSATLGGKLLPAAAYTVSYKNNTNAGTASVILTGKGNYTGTAVQKFTIAKAKNPMSVKAKKVSVKAAKVKAKNFSVKRAKALKIKGAKGKLSFKKSKGKKFITVNKKTGKITVKKGTKKGTYKVKIKVSAAGNANYNKASKTVTVKITVK